MGGKPSKGGKADKRLAQNRSKAYAKGSQTKAAGKKVGVNAKNQKRVGEK